jgi:hypothetical protein
MAAFLPLFFFPARTDASVSGVACRKMLLIIWIKISHASVISFANADLCASSPGLKA